jgi:hypothetical protein
MSGSASQNPPSPMGRCISLAECGSAWAIDAGKYLPDLPVFSPAQDFAGTRDVGWKKIIVARWPSSPLTGVYLTGGTTDLKTKGAAANRPMICS